MTGFQKILQWLNHFAAKPNLRQIFPHPPTHGLLPVARKCMRDVQRNSVDLAKRRFPSLSRDCCKKVYFLFAISIFLGGNSLG